MKTTVIIPNPVYESTEQLAQRLNVSLSELYTAALAAYVNAHQRENVTEALNQIYESEPSTMEPELVELQVASIKDEKW